MDKAGSSDFEGLYEELAMLAGLHRSCELIFRSESGGRSVIRDRVERVYTREGREWLRTAGGLEIGLDQLEQMNGIQISKNC
ncbi:MAG TPA: hypothetical protein VF939_00175 [Puia sp.]